MRNFQKMFVGLEVAPLLNSILRQPELWCENALRKTYPGSPHKEVDDIWLRFNVIPENPSTVLDDCECINYPSFYKLPLAHGMIFDLMRKVQGERLGRVLISKMKGGARIYPHVDEGAPATYYDRYHIVLSQYSNCLFRAGDETVAMQAGEVWWFDNTKEHEIINKGIDDRIHLVIDIKALK